MLLYNIIIQRTLRLREDETHTTVRLATGMPAIGRTVFAAGP